MSYVRQDSDVLDYAPCRYGTSRLVFRGPERPLTGDYAVALGGSETYGQFVAAPWPALLEAAAGIDVLNLGYRNAGPDVFLSEPALAEVIGRARVGIVQVCGAQNLTNRCYAVHPRRNDRFLRASAGLAALYPEVDFTDFNFTRHLLAELHRASPERFAGVVHELRSAWIARMQALLGLVRGRRILLWIADRPPAPEAEAELWADPLLVTREMIEALRPKVAQVVEVVVSPAARALGTAGMVYGPQEHPQAAAMPGVAAHREVAEGLLGPLVTLFADAR